MVEEHDLALLVARFPEGALINRHLERFMGQQRLVTLPVSRLGMDTHRLCDRMLTKRTPDSPECEKQNLALKTLQRHQMSIFGVPENRRAFLHFRI